MNNKLKQFNDSDVLQYALNSGMIDMDGVLNQMRTAQRELILSKHKYKIFQDKDGRWKTTVPDKTKKSGRRLIAKSDKMALEDELIRFYEDAPVLKHRNITLREIYPEWLQSRKSEVNSLMTAKKNDQDWKRYYLNTPIIDKPMNLLTVQDLKDWAHNMIDTHQLNKRNYYNMAIVMKLCFRFAVDSGLLERDTWSEVRINTKKLKKTSKKSNEREIYFSEEQQAIVQHSFECFRSNPRNLGALSIPFLFLTGVRIGELVALKYEDIDEANGVIHIHRSEKVIYEVDENGTFRYVGREVVDETKTDAGERDIPYVPQAKEIIRLIKEASERYGYYDEGYIFCPRSQRCHSISIDKRIYNYCNALGINKKSAHKIRKSYISKLIHSNSVDIDTICRTAGHTDAQTTFKSYCFSLTHKEALTEQFATVLTV